ncbi:hemolysin XhlA family protein [Lysinibacillus sp. Bpr_S20]|uniref:hemolysin XhlA family protein n=1 Tax=Lysinibacillus sp. Bpr_S20 TaxID=2933964 RepID=UPI0020124C6B|nr:hemolysin XhlA family protein [Lysinibacillus sp. Bpr_S20]MCL1701638.1 hemolysin XhlA family protein [Lysinibacillus sp. Bpr_S20]
MGDELVRNIYERLGGIEAKIDDIRDIRQTADNAKDIAEEALASTKSAHHRLNKIDKIVWWASTTIIGAVILGLLALVIKTN